MFRFATPSALKKHIQSKYRLPETSFPWANDTPVSRCYLESFRRESSSGVFFARVKQQISRAIGLTVLRQLSPDVDTSIPLGSKISLATLFDIFNSHSSATDSADVKTISDHRNRESLGLNNNTFPNSIKPLDIFSRPLWERYHDSLDVLRSENKQVLFTCTFGGNVTMHDVRMNMEVESDRAVVSEGPFLHHHLSVVDTDRKSANVGLQFQIDVAVPTSYHIDIKSLNGESLTVEKQRKIIVTLESSKLSMGPSSVTGLENMVWKVADVDYLLLMDRMFNKMVAEKNEKAMSAQEE